MSYFVDGSLALVSGQTSYTIALPADIFIEAPTLILAGVINTSTDSPKYVIEVAVTAKSVSEFSVGLSAAPNTDNYVLVWFAGGSDAIFSTPSGKRVNELPAFNGALASVMALLGFVQPNPGDSVTLQQVSPATLADIAGPWVPVPASSSSPGVLGQRAVSATHFYLHVGTQWLRIAHAGLSW